MDTKRYNNNLACKRYYDKNKDNPEFLARKRENERRKCEKYKDNVEFRVNQRLRQKRSRFKRDKPRLWKVLNLVFKTWKDTVSKEINIFHNEIMLYYILIRWKFYGIQEIYNKELLKLVFSSYRTYKINSRNRIRQAFLTVSF